MGFASKQDLKKTLNVGGQSYHYYSLKALDNPDINRLPFSLKVLLENLLRNFDGQRVTYDDIQAAINWLTARTSKHEITFQPSRVLMQDFTGVPAVVDLAAMRDAIQKMGGDPSRINPLSPVDLVIDHSVMVDAYGSSDSFATNVKREFERNRERYEFLRWGQQAFDNFRVVPPGTGICHQVNLEYLGQTVWTRQFDGDAHPTAYPDSVVGTDSHTTMINALAILGWGVGGIEAEAAMLGQPITMVIPEVVGVKLAGSLKEGTTATDLVLTVTEALRKKGVVGKFVEYFGDGVNQLSLADRATLSNMAPEYGATCGFFPIDNETINYLRLTNRDADRIALVEAYAKEQMMWRSDAVADPVFTDVVEVNLDDITSSLAGPKRPQDRVRLEDAPESVKSTLQASGVSQARSVDVEGKDFAIQDGHVVIAAITSCTNTSNPSVMVAAGLVARKAREKGLSVKPWVKTSLAPGSKVVSNYLDDSGLQTDLDALGFNLVGYGCTTCIGNSGPLDAPVAKAVDAGELSVASVLSGNRNFEGRIHPQVKLSYLASPPLVVAYALTGTMRLNLREEPLGMDREGAPVYLKDIWPSQDEINKIVSSFLTPEVFKERYGSVFEGDADWKNIKSSNSLTYDWDEKSTYVKNPPYFENMSDDIQAVDNIHGARLLALLGDSVTTDHISPAGAIQTKGPEADYLLGHGVELRDFNSFGARRGNHEVMMRGTFSNIRLKNEMVPGTSGGITKLMPEGKQMSIFDASMHYQERGTPLIVIGGKEYGTGSSRDWAAKGTLLLGVKAVIAESFERIHRSNLIGMGVMPLEFIDDNKDSLKLDGSETFDIAGLNGELKPGMDILLKVTYAGGREKNVKLRSRLDTGDEVTYFSNGGILHYVLRSMVGSSNPSSLKQAGVM
jgi:aconitate hydratase A / 2-methylisocitrate dehydratase